MSEGYPAEWKHCTIHLNPKTEEMHSDGDHSVREWIENRHRALQRDLTLALKLGQGTAEDRDQKEKDLATERDQFGKRETELMAELQSAKAKGIAKVYAEVWSKGEKDKVNEEALMLVIQKLEAKLARMEGALKKIAEIQPSPDSCGASQRLGHSIFYAKQALAQDGV